MALRGLQLLLYLLNARVQVVHQVLLLSIRCLSLSLRLELDVRVLDLLFQLLYLLLVLLDHFLAEVGSLGKFFFNLFVVL